MNVGKLANSCWSYSFSVVAKRYCCTKYKIDNNFKYNHANICNFTQSLDIDLKCLKIDVFIISTLVCTQPHLNVITGWRRGILQEPWWRVPGTAGVELTTSREDHLHRRCTGRHSHCLCHRSSHVLQSRVLQEVESCGC